MKKKFLLTLLIGFSIMLTSKNSFSQEIQVGCFSGTTGTMAYSVGNMNLIVKMLIETNETVSNTKIKYDVDTYGNGFFYLESTVGNSTVGIDLDQNGSFLKVLATKCKHACTSTGTSQCDLKIVERCVSIQCNCSVGTGGCSSSIDTGVSINQDLIDFVNNNPPNCN